MPLWNDEYPHDLHASVLLLENQIIQWKVGPNAWENVYSITIRGEIPLGGLDALAVQSTTWTVHDDKEHNDVFQKHAGKWFKQWKMHKNHRGAKPY